MCVCEYEDGKKEKIRERNIQKEEQKIGECDMYSSTPQSDLTEHLLRNLVKAAPFLEVPFTLHLSLLITGRAGVTLSSGFRNKCWEFTTFISQTS